MSDFANIKVIGVGGGGNNAVNRMVDSDLKGVQFLSANTESQVLELSKKKHVIVIGGANVYKQLMPYTSHIVRTTINQDFEADTYMCDIDEPSWRVSDGKYYHDEETGYNYRIEILKRSVNNEAVS